MRIKIESKGEARSTRVVNADTGEVVEGVTAIEWACSVNENHGAAVAKLTFILPAADIETKIDEA